jgi:hypothetical protein
MPPTANRMYLPIRGRMILSNVGRQFKQDIEWYRVANRLQVQEISEHCVRAVQSGQLLCIDREFFFQRSTIFTKKGEVKRHDLTNKIKALDDGLSSILQVDDRYIFKCSSTKQISPDPLREYVDVKVSFLDISTGYKIVL